MRHVRSVRAGAEGVGCLRFRPPRAAALCFAKRPQAYATPASTSPPPCVGRYDMYVQKDEPDPSSRRMDAHKFLRCLALRSSAWRFPCVVRPAGIGRSLAHLVFFFHAPLCDGRCASALGAAGDNPLVVGDVGSLQSILEDYLEVDRFQVRRRLV